VQKLAESCLENGCPIEDVHVLRAELKEERARLQNDLAHLNSVLTQLGTMEADLDTHIEASVAAAAEGASDEDISKLVDQIAAAFGKFKDDYPGLGSISGYSGEPHKGTKDAWDYHMD